MLYKKILTRRFILFFTLIIILLSLSCTDKTVDPVIPVTSFFISNDTGFSLDSVFLKIPTSENWGQNLLSLLDSPISLLLDQSKFTVNLNDPFSSTNRYDFYYKDIHETHYTKTNIKVKQNGTVNLITKDKNHQNHPVIKINNNTGNYIVRVSIENFDGSNISRTLEIDLPDKESTELQLLTLSLTNRYNISIIDENDTIYSKHNQLLIDFLSLNFSSNDRNPTINIKNESNYRIDNVFVRIPGQNDWGQNLLTSFLPTNQVNKVQILLRNPNFVYELRALDIHGFEYIMNNVQVVNETSLSLTVDERETLINIINKTGHTINFVTVRNSGTLEWGMNFITNNIQIDQSRYISRRVANLMNEYDILIMDINGNLYIKYEIIITSDIDLEYTTNDLYKSDYFYNTDFESEDHSWIIVNGDNKNKWFVGSATASTGDKSIYISSDNGLSNSYDNTSRSVVHFYRDIFIPYDERNIAISFHYKGIGEFVWDYLRVSIQATSFSVEPNTPVPETNVLVNMLTGIPEWQIINVTIPNEYKGHPRRIIFSWTNDDQYGTQPPAAIDNIRIGYRIELN